VRRTSEVRRTWAYMTLIDLISPGECVAVVGAGGKTTLCWMLVQALAKRGEHAIFTTTTHIRQPAPGAFDALLVGDINAATQGLAKTSWRTACIAAGIDGEPDDTPLSNSSMPAVHTKLTGYTATEINTFHTSISNLAQYSGHQSQISFVIEADGARGLLLKAPAEYEPVIPACATMVCVVASLEALGQPLDERVAHRPERIAALTGTRLGDLITPEMIVALLSHPQGGRKSIPPVAHTIAVLTHRSTSPIPIAVESIRAQLVGREYNACIILDR
jgi:molybdenum cofactor cytidylyltransferase